MSFTIPDAKFAKWIKSMLPKIETILSASNSSEYPGLDTLQSDILKSFNQSIMNGYCGGPGANKFPLSNVFEDPATDPTTTSLLYDIASFALLYICNECVQDILTTQKYLYYPNKC
jgi:hypothetical protein